MLCRYDPNTMAWSAKEILAGVALTMLTGNIISTACTHGAPPVNPKPELEDELLCYTFNGSGPVAHRLKLIAFPFNCLQYVSVVSTPSGVLPCRALPVPHCRWVLGKC